MIDSKLKKGNWGMVLFYTVTLICTIFLMYITYQYHYLENEKIMTENMESLIILPFLIEFSFLLHYVISIGDNQQL